MRTNGTAKFIGFEEYIDWYAGLSLEEAAEVHTNLMKLTEDPQIHKSYRDDPVAKCLNRMFTVTSWASWPPSETKEAKWPAAREKAARQMRRFLEFSVDLEQPVQVQSWMEGEYAHLSLGNPETGIIVLNPEKYLEYIPEKDYSHMTPLEVRTALNAPGMAQEGRLVPASAESSMTRSGVEEQLRGSCDAIEQLEKQMEDVKGAKTKELAKLQAEIDRKVAELKDKKEALMAELNERKAAMEEMKENLEHQIYLLDSEIYSIRCYAGEVVRFGKIRSGKNAPVTEPIVIHQKLRFLDEELGLLASLYEIQWGEVSLFEDFLRHSPLALDTFAPNDRCVTLVRLSRSATQLGRNHNNPYSNILEEYEYYHGRTVGIIIRNGENLYLGWTDEERVHIEDDLLVGKVVTDIAPEPAPEFVFESDRKRYIKEQKQKRKKLLDGIISRSFIYNILQGIVDNTPILPLPAGARLNKQSEYVIYAIADKWLTDDRYGSFTEIVERCNEKVTKGDMLLTVQKLVPEHEHYVGGRLVYGANAAWDNARGRGDANRTHDCSVDDCTIYPANLVEYDDPVSMTRYRYLIKPNNWTLEKNPDAKPYWQENTMPTKDYERTTRSYDEEVLETYEYRKRHVFVSVKKTDSYNWEGYRGDARANFELYKSEYLNLTYLNSVWLQWVITNKKLGGWTIGGKQVEYAHAIRYLKTAMDFIREREAREKELLDLMDAGICQMPDWPVRLSEWKLASGVREITEYQAKRFARAIGKDGSNG